MNAKYTKCLTHFWSFAIVDQCLKVLRRSTNEISNVIFILGKRPSVGISTPKYTNQNRTGLIPSIVREEVAEINEELMMTPTTSTIKILPKRLEMRASLPSPSVQESSAANVESAHMEILDFENDVGEPGTSSMLSGGPANQPEVPHTIPHEPPLAWLTESAVQNPDTEPLIPPPPKFDTGARTKPRKRPLPPLLLEEKNPASLEKGELYRRAIIKQYELATAQLETDKITRTTYQDVVNGLNTFNDASSELTSYFKRLTEVEEEKLALKQKHSEEKMAMKREKHEIYKKRSKLKRSITYPKQISLDCVLSFIKQMFAFYSHT